ncbi:hypothetical protein [Salisediminibacterium halotolerans]|uniref:hypothetical protein n=1 Tax=Salisediminibacterium halotolerans TaxID=517425 RepID=UPI000EB41C22|nr:hypothetical protein [Salisediminibacterium halotolerans]RLJ72200.1 hypothetical protein BCL39_2092 [Actinophytocola xinjiangensis]RPE85413.1 hypothetical protein EDD67_2227 [Salisediminibacterium halotolerans]TWG33370.1 hypothetical protein BCL52_2089 [Salisediminibacterium halotolerans]GEL07100.1 hypothetical protein SHA02_05160 [Salisediminibacterium halotolerans]
MGRVVTVVKGKDPNKRAFGRYGGVRHLTGKEDWLLEMMERRQKIIDEEEAMEREKEAEAKHRQNNKDQ